MNFQPVEQAMPGDQIQHDCQMNGICWSTVKAVSWIPGAKGGKVFVYELYGGVLVPFSDVIAIRKRVPRPEIENLEQVKSEIAIAEAKRDFHAMLDAFG